MSGKFTERAGQVGAGDGCVAYHTRVAWKHGATRAEVAETVGTAVYMGGGPAAVYGADALRASDEFSPPPVRT